MEKYFDNCNFLLQKEKEVLNHVYSILRNDALSFKQEKTKQFYYAIVFDGEILKSYNTIVGYADKAKWKYYTFGKYSTTTSKQLTQFYNEYFSGYDRIFIDIQNPFKMF